jgi:hypothetical protein
VIAQEVAAAEVPVEVPVEAAKEPVCVPEQVAESPEKPPEAVDDRFEIHLDGTYIGPPAAGAEVAIQVFPQRVR